MKKGKKRTIVGILILLLLVAGLFIWINSRQNRLNLDANQEEGTLVGLTDEELRELMNNKVEEGKFEISINTQPVFENGKAEGTLRIENSASNRYLMVIKMYLVEKDGSEGEKIYESGAIKPGHKLEKAPLDKELSKGAYSVSVHFEAYDTSSMEYVGQAVTHSNIIIKN